MHKSDSISRYHIFHPQYGEHVLLAPKKYWHFYDWEFFFQHWRGRSLMGVEYSQNKGQAGMHTIYSGFSWAQSWEKSFLDILLPSTPILIPKKLAHHSIEELTEMLAKPEIFSSTDLVLMPVMPKNPLLLKGTLLLDRDGIINVDHGYVSNLERLTFMPGIFDILNWAKKTEIDVFVLTNQSGIAKGLYSEEDMHLINQSIQEKIKEAGGEIKEFFYCPYHHEATEKKYEFHSMQRKPGPGMLWKAAVKHGISLARSVMLGDKPSDILIGGVKTLLLKGNYQLEGVSTPRNSQIFNSLPDIHQYLQRHQADFLANY